MRRRSIRSTHPHAGRAAIMLVCAVALAGAAPVRAHAAASPESTAVSPSAAPAVSAFQAPRLAGYIQGREVAQRGVGLTSSLNRARFSLDGGLPVRFSYRVLVEMEASAGARNPATVSLREAILKWSPAPFAITVGQFKTPFSREYLIPVPLVETADLATAVDSLAPKYDVGVMGDWAISTFGTVTLGVFNGEGQNAIANRDSTVMVVARAVATPIPQLAIGGNATRDGPDSLRWGLEIDAEQSGAVVRSEYITGHRRGRARDLDDYGWYVFGSYRVTPRVQLIARQEDFRRPALGAAKRISGTTVGANLEIAPNRVRLLLEGLRRITGANRLRTDSFIAQLQVRF